MSSRAQQQQAEQHENKKCCTKPILNARAAIAAVTRLYHSKVSCTSVICTFALRALSKVMVE